MKIETAIKAVMLIGASIRLFIAGILITASYELDTYALRLGFICVGIWMIIMVAVKLFRFGKFLKQISENS